jgi:hypothetical protein
MDHDRREFSTPATRCATGIMPVAVSLSNAPPTATPSSVLSQFRSTITPVLTVRDAAQAIVFYGRAFGAEEIYRNTYPDGRIVVEMAVEGARSRVADEAPDASDPSPHALNGTTQRIPRWGATRDGSCMTASIRPGGERRDSLRLAGWLVDAAAERPGLPAIDGRTT